MLRAFDFCGFTTRPEMAANWFKIERRLGEEVRGEVRNKRMLSTNKQSLWL